MSSIDKELNTADIDNEIMTPEAKFEFWNFTMTELSLNYKNHLILSVWT